MYDGDERFRTLADAAPVMIWMADGGPGCTFFNQGWLNFTGRTLDQEKGEGWISCVHADDRDRIRQQYLGSFQARTPFIMEYRLRRFDGEYRWILDHGNPRFDRDGTFAGFIGSCVDVTDRREVEARLRDSEARYRFLAENTRDLISRHTLDGTFLFASPSWRARMGYEPEELFGRSAYEFFHPDDVNSIQSTHGFILDHTDSKSVSYRFRHKAGHFVWLESNSQVVREWESGSGVNIVCVSRETGQPVAR